MLSVRGRIISMATNDPRLTEWLAWGRGTRRWAGTTCGEYRRRVGGWLDWCQREGIAPSKAKADDVRAWLDSLHPSPSVRTNAHTAVIAWFDWRVVTKGAKHNPAREVERVPVRRVIPRSLEPEAVTAVLTAAIAYGPRWGCYVGLLAYAGLRRVEACRVRWVDIEGGDAWLRVLGKGDQERVLPIHDRLRGLIVRWRSEHTHPVWMFPGRDGRSPICVATATLWMRRILDDAGFPGATGHWLRHSFGTRILEVTGDVAAAKEALRHQSLGSTTVYTMARPARVAEAVARLDY